MKIYTRNLNGDIESTELITNSNGDLIQKVGIVGSSEVRETRKNFNPKTVRGKEIAAGMVALKKMEQLITRKLKSGRYFETLAEAVNKEIIIKQRKKSKNSKLITT